MKATFYKRLKTVRHTFLVDIFEFAEENPDTRRISQEIN